MPSYFIGVDPGKGGGVAVINGTGERCDTFPMPANPGDLVTSLGYHRKDAIALLEYVRASPQMGRASAFTFGREFGKCETALYAARIPFRLITPPAWQGLMKCRTGGDKAVTHLRATRLFPEVKVTHAIADALLLAECCRMLEHQRRATPARAQRR